MEVTLVVMVVVLVLEIKLVSTMKIIEVNHHIISVYRISIYAFLYQYMVIKYLL